MFTTLSPRSPAVSPKEKLYSSAERSWSALRARQPYSAQNHAVLATFDDITGWTGAGYKVTINGEPMLRVDAPASAFASGAKDYGAPFVVGGHVMYDVWVADATRVANIAVYFMVDTSNFYYYDKTSGWQNGTNRFNIVKSQFKTTGAPTWAAVQKIQFKVWANASGTASAALGKVETFDRRPMCIVWFDDGYSSVYTEAFPYMQTQGFPAAVSVIGRMVGTAGFMNRKQLKELQNAGWDLVNHTFNHKTLTSVSLQEAEYEIVQGLEHLQGLAFGSANFLFVYPQSATSDALERMRSRYAAISRYGVGYNNMPLDMDHLVAQSIENTTPVATVQGYINTAIADQKCVILLFHAIQDPADAPTKYAPADFRSVMDYLATRSADIDTVTPTEALARM